MLEIKNINKDYTAGSDIVHALKDVSICFRESELVSVLGHSGCGNRTHLPFGKCVLFEISCADIALQIGFFYKLTREHSSR